MKRISLIFGTRPEAIKLCPLVKKMGKIEGLEPHVCVTAQHRQMLDQVLDIFDVKPDVDLDLMQPGQSLGGLTSRAIAAIDEYLFTYKPDMVLVQGDTTTVFCAALCAFYHQIPVGHVEAGLRTWNKYSPFPEEINRVLTTQVTSLHFAPTETSKQNLLLEGVKEESIYVTGNTVIDALNMTVGLARTNPPAIAGLPEFLQSGKLGVQPRMVLITGHRRENLGDGFENICNAIRTLAHAYSDVHFVYPVHLNPNVREPVNRILATLTEKNVHLIEPLDYFSFVAMMDRSYIILTDSGGVQEEAPSIGKPVLVMRNTTERPEAVDMGTVRLVGTDAEIICKEVSLLLDDRSAYKAMANSVNPYGDGNASINIAKILEDLYVRHGEFN